MRRQCQLDYMDNRVLKDTLRLKIYGHGSKYHETKINEGALKIITHKKKNAIAHFKEHYIKIDDISLLLYTSLSL